MIKISSANSKVLPPSPYSLNELVSQIIKINQAAGKFTTNLNEILVRPLSPSSVLLANLKKENEFYKKFVKLDDEALFECSIFILKKDCKCRSPNEVQIIRRFTEQLEFFKSLIAENGKDYHIKCCSVLKNKFYPKNSIIIDYNSQAKFFSIIASGRVLLFSYDDENYNSLNFNNTENTGENMEEIREIKELTIGETFGDLSLIGDKQHQLGVISKEDCHLLIIEKRDFNQILSEIERNNLIKKLKFFKNLKVFEDCSYAQINSLFYNFKEINCQKNYIVFSENEDADQMYFIREGEFAIYKNINKQEFHTKSQRSAMSKKRFKLTIINKGDIFGFDDIHYNRKRTYWVQCESLDGGLIYSVDKNIFIKKLKENRRKHDEFIKDQIEKHDRILGRFENNMKVFNENEYASIFRRSKSYQFLNHHEIHSNQTDFSNKKKKELSEIEVINENLKKIMKNIKNPYTYISENMSKIKKLLSNKSVMGLQRNPKALKFSLTHENEEEKRKMRKIMEKDKKHLKKMIDSENYIYQRIKGIERGRSTSLLNKKEEYVIKLLEERALASEF